MTQSEKQVVLQKLQKYCAYQDRCHQEVRRKLLGLEVYGDDLEEVIYELVQDNFLNEERFARSFARGKYRIKKWGKYRIKSELKQRQISDYCIRKAMTEIDEEEYQQNLISLVAKYHRDYDHLTPMASRKKIVSALQRKGYSFHEIELGLNDYKSDN